ncbi:hypothetical protein V8C26DRAFT_413775 [Trichoderma gracile]
MATTAPLTPEEARDRLNIRRVIERYSQCADRCLPEEQASLFIAEPVFHIYMQGQGTEPTQAVTKREDLVPIFEYTKGCKHTSHVLGQSTIDIEADGKTATGETYCLAHYLSEKDGQRQMWQASLRYHDILKKQDDGFWQFAERKLIVDWTETRPSNP